MSKILYKNYISLVEANIVNDQKYFWQFLRDGKDGYSVPGIMRYKGDSADNGVNIANLFAEYLSTVYVKEDSVNYILRGTDNNDANRSNIFTIQEMYNLLSEIKCSDKTGPDLIPGILIKNCVNSLAQPIYNLFRMALNNGVVTRKISSFRQF